MRDMTEEEQLGWVRLLGPTLENRIAVIQDLLRHKAEDRMSCVDRAICLRQLARLQGEAAKSA